MAVKKIIRCARLVSGERALLPLAESINEKKGKGRNGDEKE
jgi:hypothetical protein